MAGAGGEKGAGRSGGGGGSVRLLKIWVPLLTDTSAE